VAPFIDDMADAYEWADLVICRSGALTVSELALAGRAAILVPLPHAIDDHQTKNARILSDAGAGQVVVQDEQLVSKLVQLLLGLLAMPGRVIAMGEAASAMAAPGATGQVVDAVEEVAGDR
jgi:UDP-N-acetylglucosamine--N-acetylmuramyl-(pentapeptide) pyrophosphoryl-undecaprenol N-acetylglucosamine transferase